MKKVSYYIVALLVLLLLGCNKEKNAVESIKPSVTTLEATDVRMFSATLHGSVVLPDPIAPDFELGFQVSTSILFPNDSTEQYKVSKYSEQHTFSYSLDNFRQGTTYYVRSYMLNQMCEYLGESKIITLDTLTVETGDFNADSRTITSHTNIQQQYGSRKVVLGVGYGVNQLSSVNDVKMVTTNVIDPKGYFSVSLPDIPCDTFIYCSFVIVDGDVCYGEEKTFKTEEPEIHDEQTLPVFNDVLDSMKLNINVKGPWTISIAKGGEWCTVSALKSNTNTDEIVTVYVAENPTASERQTSLILSWGTSDVVYHIIQKAAPWWYETDYWHRTDLQRNGIRGKVHSIQDIQVGVYTATYSFDETGNLITMDYAAKAEEGKGYVHSYTITRRFDEAGHLMHFEKISAVDTMTVDYEYTNGGKLVASSLYLPVEMSFNDLERTSDIVPDLSAFHMVIKSARTESVSDSKFTFEGSKLLNERNIQMIVDGNIIVDTHDTVYWEYHNDKPYSCDVVTNVVYADNGMFKKMDMSGYRYYFEENSRSLIVKTMEDQGYIDRTIGQVIKAEYSINENHDWTSAVVTVKGKTMLYKDCYEPFYDHHNNWTSNDRTFYYPTAGEQVHQTMTRRIDYYE